MTCQSSFSASERCAPQSGYEPDNSEDDTFLLQA
jgi:hypothetical protein